MTTTRIMTTLSLVAAIGAAAVVVTRHANKPATAATIAAATEERPAAATTMAYRDVGHYESKPIDPAAIEEAKAKMQADEQRSADVARARELEAEVTAGPPDPAIATRANDLVEGLRRLALPGMDHLAAGAAECGRGACRVRIPSELVEPLRSHFANSASDMRLFAFDPRDDVGSAIVYVLPAADAVSSATVP